VLLAFCWGTRGGSSELINRGRGQYPQALAYIAGRTTGETVRVAASDGAEVALMLWFYGPRVSAKRFEYEPHSDGRPTTSPWFIVSSKQDGAMAEPTIVISDRQYVLERSYDCFPSFSRWFVYARSESP
jgi:hypothetical protein